MSTYESRRCLTVADTAKLIRKALKAEFPGTKFSVRSHSYSGGASVHVNWTDGPTEERVSHVGNLYQGASFDGMIDLQSYHDSIITTDDGAELVHFGADYVICQRRISDGRMKFYERELRRFVEDLGEEWKGLDGATRYPVSCHKSYDENDPSGQLSRDRHNGDYGSTLLNRMAHLREWTGERCEGGEGSYCPTCGRWQGAHRAPHAR